MYKKISTIIVCCFGAALFAGSMFGNNQAEASSVAENNQTKADENSLEKISDYSKMVADNYQSINDYYTESLSVDGLSRSQKKEYLSRDDIYAVGNNIAVSKAEVQQYTEFYLNNGESEENAQKLAEKDAMERNALYVAAIQNGYEVTDEDINDWLTELRTMLENDTTGVYQSAMEGFDSEDAYWEYEYEVYRVDLPIQNYVSSLQIDTNVSADSENGNTDTDAFSELKQRLADEQDFKLTNL